jgi:hypothetical protein
MKFNLLVIFVTLSGVVAQSQTYNLRRPRQNNVTCLPVNISGLSGVTIGCFNASIEDLLPGILPPLNISVPGVSINISTPVFTNTTNDDDI